MKIFSNFDSKWKQEALDEAIKEFGEDKVLVLTKSRLFYFYKFLFPVLGWTIVLLIILVVPYLMREEMEWMIYGIYTVFMLILYLFSLFKPIKYYIDYKMDFSIVTPRALTRYNQSWILRRDIKTSNARNIKTIAIRKNNFLYNLFDNGDLIFLSEWNVERQGEITLHFIYDPEERKKEIVAIMSLSTPLGANE